MNVLFFTRRVDKNDPRIGFVHRWIEEMASRVNKIYVVCLDTGEMDLPDNVEVKKLGKNKLQRTLMLNRCMFSLVPNVDVVFCHMNPIYTILSAPYAKLFGKKLYMWHTHGTVTKKLKIAHFLADGLLTASKESVGIRSDKVISLGHGIDTNFFKPQDIEKKGILLISVGRISPVKKLELLILGMSNLIKEHNDAKLLVIGGVPIESQEAYLKELKSLVSKLNLSKNVEFIGPVDYTEIPELYNKADALVSASATGSLDKTVLEAMSCGLPPVVKGTVYMSLKGPTFFRNEKDFSEAVNKALNMKNKKSLREEIVDNHNLTILMERIIKLFKT